MFLEDIIISRVRVKILELFLLNPNKIYHVREIVRRVDEEINAVRRELSHMEKTSMVSKERRANRLFYVFRKDHVLYDDLLRLVNKSAGLGGALIKNKPKLGKIRFVMLSARYARGIAKKSTQDVDLLVVGTVVLPELAAIVKEEEARRDTELNYTVMTDEEFTFRKSRRDPFALSIINGSRLMIIGDEEDLIRV